MTRRNGGKSRGASEQDAMGQLVDALYAQLLAVAKDEDDETKMSRATKLLQAATPEVTAILILGMCGALDELEERLEAQDGQLEKSAAAARAEAGS